ncbi:MAG: hypothetical protein HY901_06225 [Deltaproteobacteria bacterium]|nr:hypothetical protein [Deltaproteobacteria bacterium]
MAKNKDTKEKRERSDATSPLSARPGWVQLLSAGNHRTVRGDARRVLADPAAAESDKAAAREVLARTALDAGSLGAGLGVGAALLTILALVYL